ncbi:hypothetical protein SEA_KUDEFRE_73 [Gordonia phage Kudefre]|uniref:Uncharacterized protein n=1 Tax=Gordonia phage Kudefre TaxID=2885975 RepID=A0AAE8Y682_9CAUD|nr:hypothetical protein L3Y24_gp073 [Gordonia phage Kudefre]UDL15302.1 hypothetical protein SEA_KUDEFRE_73 [Gordonia phage Kudefre]
MTNTLEGREIRGDISHYGSQGLPEQKPINELLIALDTLLAFPEVEAVRWEQYTPYFNDGDACEFGVREASLKFADGLVDLNDPHIYSRDGFVEDSMWPPNYWDTHADKKYNWRTREYDPLPEGKAESNYRDMGLYVDGVERKDIQEALDAFSSALEGGAHELALKKHFGDPAQVTATATGFDVEFYDHD